MLVLQYTLLFNYKVLMEYPQSMDYTTVVLHVSVPGLLYIIIVHRLFLLLFFHLV